MKAYGQLEVAQLENLVADPGTALAVGRMWINIATATRGIPKYYDGNAIRNFDVENFNAIGNSGTAITIDWSIATTQSLTLSANCVVTHSNLPTNGKVCTLIVIQSAANPPFRVVFPKDNYWQKNPIPTVIPVGSAQRFQFVSATGFLPAITSLAGYISPNTNTVAAMAHAAFSKDGTFVSYCDGSTGLWAIGVKQGPLGLYFGGPISATAAGSTTCVAWHPSGGYVAVSSATTPFIQVFPFSNGEFGPAIPNPTNLPPATVTSIDWAPGGDALVWSSATTPFIGGYGFSGGLFNANFANPATAAAAACSIKVHPSGGFVAVGLNAAPGICAYIFNTVTGFGTKSSAPSPATFLCSQIPDAIAFSPDGLFVAAACTVTPFIHIWPFSAGGAFGTVVTNPATLPASQVYGCAFTPYNDYFFCTTRTGSTVLYSYPWTGAFGTLGANPTSLPVATNLEGVMVHPSGEFVSWFGATTPFMGNYSAPRVVKNVLGSQG